MAGTEINLSWFPNPDTPIWDQSNQDGNRSAALSISGVTGSITDGSTMTISGTGFQSPPTFKREDFSGFTSLGEDLTTSNSNFDIENAYYKATSVADSRSGTYSANMYAESSLTAGSYTSSGNTFNIAGDPDEVFVSYSVKNPTGKRMPGNPIPAANTFSVGSDCKFTWLQRDNTVTNDIVLPTLVQDRFSLAGNGLTNRYTTVGGAAPSYWRFGEWVRMTTWLKAGAIPEVNDGDIYFQGMNEVDGMFEYDTPTNPIVFGGTSADSPYSWKKIIFAGWMREQTGSPANVDEIVVLYDDIYVAYGDNAAARVEIGDNAVYANCTKLSVCDHVTWASGTITAKVRQSDLNFGASVYLHLTLADNSTRVVEQII